MNTHAVFTNHARVVLFGTGQIAEAGHCFHLAQVDYQLMRISDIVYSHPEGRFLQVEYLVCRPVAAACFFAIGITDFPMFTGYRFAGSLYKGAWVDGVIAGWSIFCKGFCTFIKYPDD